MFQKRADGQRSRAAHTIAGKPRYEKDGIEGLREPKSHAVHNPRIIDPEIERRIAQWIWKELCTRKCLGLPVFIKGRKVTADDVIKRYAGREGMEGCGGIDDGFGRGYRYAMMHHIKGWMVYLQMSMR